MKPVPFLKKVKAIILFLSCIILLIGCKKEIIIDKNVSDIGTVFGSGVEHFLNDVLQTKDGGYLLCGTTIKGEHGNFDGYVLKVDSNFNTIWYKNYGGLFEDYFTSMAIDEDENIMLCGYSASFGVSVLKNVGYWNTLFYMVYTDKDGNMFWDSTFQANPGAQNYDNRGMKINYLKNKTFAISGITRNYLGLGGGLSYDAFAFGMDNSSKITWSKHFTLDGKAGFQEEFCNTSILDENNNLILQIRNDDSISSKIILLKTETNSSGFSTNSYIWKSSALRNITSTEYSVISYMEFQPMVSLGGNKVAIANAFNKNLEFTDDLGNNESVVRFKYPVYIRSMHIQNGVLQIGGIGQIGNRKCPAFIAVDTKGNILNEIYLENENYLNSSITPLKVFYTPQNQFVVMGIIETVKGTNIIMIKLDSHGKALK